MTLLLLLPTVLSLLIFCGHLVRSGMVIFVPPVFLVLCLLVLSRGWVARLFQVLLVGVALEWVRVAVYLGVERQEAGEPWLRMALILGGVAAFAVFAAALFETPTLQRAYPRY